MKSPPPRSCLARMSLNSTFFLSDQKLRDRVDRTGEPRRGLHLSLARHAHGAKTDAWRENPHVGNASPIERIMAGNGLGRSSERK